MNELTDHLQTQFSSATYSHHQKSVICDADPCVPGSARRLIAFVGGLDLTGGRYDTPNHELFSTLLDEHDGDFRNCNAKIVSPHQGMIIAIKGYSRLVATPHRFQAKDNFLSLFDVVI